MLNIDDTYETGKLAINQYKSDFWHKHRHVRLTASNFHRIIKRKDNFQELGKSIVNPA